MATILVVDDDIDAADSFSLLLEACGHDVRTAFDGTDGLLASMQYRPHIIFLDLEMPGLNGYSTAEAIRRASNYSPFIAALTARSGVDVQARVQAAGFDFYIQKPADANMLLALIDDMARCSRTGPMPAIRHRAPRHEPRPVA